MATTEVFTGDTITLRCTFTGLVVEGEPAGDVIDPDGQAASVTIYNADELSIETGTPSRVSQGIYQYEWTAPTVAGSYWVEFKGLFNTEPQLKRRKFSVKFKGDQ